MRFNTFILKIASRCNLDCSYCYVYNSIDASWRTQPPFMSASVAYQTAVRIREYCEENAMPSVVVNCHGGEPLLGGEKHLATVFSAIREGFAESKVFVSSAVQSNGLLFTDAIGEALLAHEVGLFLSVDGPPDLNDRHRVDHRGLPSSSHFEQTMQSLMTPAYRTLFEGFLCVVDPTFPPVTVLDYLLSYDPGVIDFLLPLANHDRPPPHPVEAYGDWLCACFDYWFASNSKTRIRSFDSIILQLCSHAGASRGGLGYADAIVVETDGTIEADDTIKSTADGGARLGLNVFEHSFSHAANHPLIRTVQSGRSGLTGTCLECPVVNVCGGGHISHRYSTDRRFLNESVYCRALEQLILHIRAAILKELDEATQPTR